MKRIDMDTFRKRVAKLVVGWIRKHDPDNDVFAEMVSDSPSRLINIMELWINYTKLEYKTFRGCGFCIYLPGQQVEIDLDAITAFGLTPLEEDALSIYEPECLFESDEIYDSPEEAHTLADEMKRKYGDACTVEVKNMRWQKIVRHAQRNFGFAGRDITKPCTIYRVLVWDTVPDLPLYQLRKIYKEQHPDK